MYTRISTILKRNGNEYALSGAKERGLPDYDFLHLPDVLPGQGLFR
jgi:hypothetical protein